MHGRLFVAYQDMAQTGPGVQRVVQGQHGAAGIAEYGVDAEREQGVDQHAGTG